MKVEFTSTVLCLITLFPIISSFTISKRVAYVNSKFLCKKNIRLSEKVKVFDTEKDVKTALCEDLISCARHEITTKGKFYVAVPGGSVLKMLSGLQLFPTDIDWTKVFLFYVNHKCVANDNESSTHFKAQKYFINFLNVPTDNVVSLTGTADSVNEAVNYSNKIQTLVPKSSNGMPVFDYMLLGMGKDGHIGSLYPNRGEPFVTPDEVLFAKAYALSVAKKDPPSITLSLPIMNNSKEIRIVLTGEDKADAALHGIKKDLSLKEFPAVGIDDRAIWFIDKPCAAKL